MVCDKLGLLCTTQTEHPASELSELNEQKQGMSTNLKKLQTGAIHPSLIIVIIDTTRWVALKGDRVKNMMMILYGQLMMERHPTI